MAQVLRPGTTLIRETVQSGEITINLNLTIKLDSDGLSVKAETAEPVKKAIQTYDIEEDPELMIPEIEMGEMIDFGRKV